MSSCLGIYIQNNLIKYAKVSKERNNVKVDAYGVKFYDADVENVIEQIVKETFSYQIPISVNITNEKYTYSTVFALLKQQDIEKAINTEFEFFCNNNNKNKNTIEYRALQMPNMEDKDKLRVLYAYTEKTNIVEKIQQFDKYKVQNISPIAMIIPNLDRTIEQEKCIVINIEDSTEITTITNGKIYKIDRIDTGMKKILSTIAERENSIQKAYEICKNTTVYTKAGQNLKIEGNEYLEDIMINLQDIIEQTKETIIKNGIEIDNIYITGMGLMINNIDLLFQENFIEKKCEILVPYFVEKTNVKINIKDYLEVNSAISLALQGLDPKKKETNFNNSSKTKDLLSMDVSQIITILKNRPKKTSKEVLNIETDFMDNILLRISTALLLIIILYMGASYSIKNQLNTKIAETNEAIEKTNNELAKIEETSKLINTRTNEYQNLVKKIDDANSKISETYLSKNAIPNLLNKVMQTIPTGVQLVSINNASGKRIEIIAQAKKYDQLGYFKAALEEEGILTNITSTKGIKQDNLISITITGELPY